MQGGCWVKIAFLATFCSLAKLQAAALDPLDWLAQLDAKSQEEWLGSFPLNILFVSKLQPEREVYPLKVNPLLFNRAGYLKIKPTADLQWSFKLNRFEKVQTQTTHRHGRTYTLFSRLAEADTIVYAPQSRKEAWSLLMRDGGRLRRIDQPFTAARLTPSLIYEWLFELVGYNGVVLDQRDSWVLVGSASKVFKEGDQAVVYERSTKSYFLKEQEKTEASAILECEQAKLGYGVFKILISKNPPKIGDKITIVGQD